MLEKMMQVCAWLGSIVLGGLRQVLLQSIVEHGWVRTCWVLRTLWKRKPMRNYEYIWTTFYVRFY